MIHLINEINGKLKELVDALELEVMQSEKLGDIEVGRLKECYSLSMDLYKGNLDLSFWANLDGTPFMVHSNSWTEEVFGQVIKALDRELDKIGKL